jgi:hypothetical protein
MAGKGHSGHQSVDHHTFRYRGPSGDPVADSFTVRQSAGSVES